MHQRGTRGLLLSSVSYRSHFIALCVQSLHAQFTDTPQRRLFFVSWILDNTNFFLHSRIVLKNKDHSKEIMVIQETILSNENKAPSIQSHTITPFPEPTNPNAAEMLADFFRGIVLDVDPNAWDQSRSPSPLVFEWKLGTSSQQRVLLSFTTDPNAAKEFALHNKNDGPVIFIAQTRSTIGVPHSSEGTRKLRYYFYEDQRYSQGRADVFEMTDSGIMHKHGLSVGGWKSNAASLLRVLQVSLGVLDFPDTSDAISIIARAIRTLEPPSHNESSR